MDLLLVFIVLVNVALACLALCVVYAACVGAVRLVRWVAAGCPAVPSQDDEILALLEDINALNQAVVEQEELALRLQLRIAITQYVLRTA